MSVNFKKLLYEVCVVLGIVFTSSAPVGLPCTLNKTSKRRGPGKVSHLVPKILILCNFNQILACRKQEEHLRALSDMSRRKVCDVLKVCWHGIGAHAALADI